ncbi:hypothetical protein MKI84_12920 [Ancylobacter sp. A5.8]|uniref:hypothetical protein n=1 Tax=Ancylobacter gelatini TaxID=2919920 RepID=UPI001F4D5091|nr:hypothetical protein [Ancylobacter gelatini]MCJ8143819.1 hypothetical protein [Ancylobacter gelatini]
MSSFFEDAVTAVMNGNFDQFDKLQKDQAENSKKERRRAQEARERLAGCAARLAESDDGRALLDWIAERTLRRVTFLVMPGMPADQVALMGAKREGANELAFEIARLVAEGRGETLLPRT